MVRMAEWSKAPDSSSGLRERAWVQIPLLTFAYFFIFCPLILFRLFNAFSLESCSHLLVGHRTVFVYCGTIISEENVDRNDG
ncbi:hypothetical protein VNO77_30018 [Canavalia gladiata]|uniref:Uncharacterized protein n=1 Tax=Canavalia gladiata TaxID=3824 RepID=A0AAN9Q438_CANGL